MQIIADEQIPLVAEAFASLGTVTQVPHRALTAALLAQTQAEVLLVRSVTSVDARLLANTAVRFVGTATIGTDHLDTDYLQQQGIHYASAPGCNAEAVAEYVLSALCVLATRQGFELPARTVGIVGYGNTGRALAAKLAVLGVQVLRNDPPLAQRHPEAAGFCDLDTLLKQADIISLHVPLTRQGPHPTYHLFDAERLSAMRPGSMLINTSRGSVVDNGALLTQLQQHHLRAAVLDVWEGEPRPNPALLAAVTLGTPHIAGYSQLGKLRATAQLYQALGAFLEQPPQWHLPPLPVQTLSFSDPPALEAVLGAAYDISADDRRLRAMLTLPEAERGAAFEQLRKSYPFRPEYSAFRVTARGALRNTLLRLGFLSQM